MSTYDLMLEQATEEQVLAQLPRSPGPRGRNLGVRGA